MGRKIGLASLLLFVVWPALPARAVDGDAVCYVGGTLPALAEGQDGHFDMSSRELLRFTGAKGTWQVSYRNITKLAYGRKAGRQVAAGIIVSPFWLAAPKRKHYLTLQIKDDSGKLQVGVFELSKARYVETIADLEERSGLKVEVEDPEKKGAHDSTPAPAKP